MLTPAKRHGITHDFTRKDGARRCPTALRFPSMVPPMSPDDMYGRANILSSEPAARRRFCCTSCKRLRTSEDPTWVRMSDSVSKRKTHGRTASYAAMSSLPSPRPSPSSCLAPHQSHRAHPHSPPDEHLHLPTTQRLPPKCLADKAEMLSGLPLEARMEGDSSSNRRKILPADLPSLERFEPRALETRRDNPPSSGTGHLLTRRTPSIRWDTARRQTIIPYISNIYSFYSFGLEPELPRHCLTTS